MESLPRGYTARRSGYWKGNGGPGPEGLCLGHRGSYIAVSLCPVSLCMHSECGIPVALPQTLQPHPLPNLPALWLVSTKGS